MLTLYPAMALSGTRGPWIPALPEQRHCRGRVVEQRRGGGEQPRAADLAHVPDAGGGDGLVGGTAVGQTLTLTRPLKPTTGVVCVLDNQNGQAIFGRYPLLWPGSW